jgi:hypothetical protein
VVAEPFVKRDDIGIDIVDDEYTVLYRQFATTIEQLNTGR